MCFWRRPTRQQPLIIRERRHRRTEFDIEKQLRTLRNEGRLSFASDFASSFFSISIFVFRVYRKEKKNSDAMYDLWSFDLFPLASKLLFLLLPFWLIESIDTLQYVLIMVKFWALLNSLIPMNGNQIFLCWSFYFILFFLFYCVFQAFQLG